jgi:hypothetical protein
MVWTKLDQPGPKFDEHRNDAVFKLLILKEIGSSGRTRTSPENPATLPIESILPQIFDN